MKTVEEIEREYEKFHLVSTYVTSLDAFLILIDTNIDNIEEEIRVIQRDIRSNTYSQKFVKFRNRFPFLFEMEEIGIYNEDNKILKEEFEFFLGYKEKYKKLASIVTNETFRELTRLADFSWEYYNQHMDYFTVERDSLEYSYQGFTYCNSQYQNNIPVFNKFFDKKLSEYNEEKKLMKRKRKQCG